MRIPLVLITLAGLLRPLETPFYLQTPFSVLVIKTRPLAFQENKQARPPIESGKQISVLLYFDQI